MSDRTRHFIEQFFGPSNQFDLEKIEQSTGSQSKIRPWVERLTQAEPQPTVLPRWHKAGVDWYGIAQGDRQLRSLSEELMAFVGSTYSTFRGRRAQLNLQDPIDASVYEFTQGAAVKFCGKPDGGAKQIWESLERMRRVSDRSCKQIAQFPRPTGRVLRDFYMALQAGDRLLAEKELQYLQAGHRLDAVNLLFLRVQLLAELEQWHELLDLSELPHLLQVRRPFAVTQALLQAVYLTQFQQFEENNASTSAVAYFREVVFPRYSNLFTVRASSMPEVLKLFMLQAVGGEPPQPARRDQLLALVQGIDESHHPYIQKLAALLPAPASASEENSLQLIEKLIENGEYDRAFTSLSDIFQSKEKVHLLLQCAYELQTLSAEKAALQAFFELNIEDQKALQVVRWNRDYLAQLQGDREAANENSPVAASVPNNWLEWLAHLDRDPQWERSLYTARQGSLEWDVTSLLAQPRAGEEFIQLLDKAASKAETVLHNALPYLLAFFQKDDRFPRREFVTIYRSLLELLVLSTEGGEADLALFNELAIALFSLGVNAADYVEITNYALELWSHFAAPKKVDWVLDLLDILVMYPCPSKPKRVQLLFAVAETLRCFAERIDEDRWKVFRILVKDLNLEESLPDLLGEQASRIEQILEGEEHIWQKLQGKTVLIYTLTESAALRVKSILESACHDVTVYLSHDKGGSDRLRQWVKNSDFVVMVTASAKHAATSFIEASRPQHLTPILLVNSKGSAGMMREIRHYLTK